MLRKQELKELVCIFLNSKKNNSEKYNASIGYEGREPTYSPHDYDFFPIIAVFSSGFFASKNQNRLFSNGRNTKLCENIQFFKKYLFNLMWTKIYRVLTNFVIKVYIFTCFFSAPPVNQPWPQLRNITRSYKKRF